jgi:hypothetical protein
MQLQHVFKITATPLQLDTNGLRKAFNLGVKRLIVLRLVFLKKFLIFCERYSERSTSSGF